MLRIAVLLSGSGTTLQNLVDRIADGRLAATIVTVVSSRSDVIGVERARRAGLPLTVVRRKDCASDELFGEKVFDPCRQSRADLVVMGGFLQLVPIPDDFTNRVLNIHPSLLPAFGGPGMYGKHVHEAVLNYGAKVSGCTVHFVDQQYDHGPIVLQRTVEVQDDDTPESLSARVFAAECDAYPEAINWFAKGALVVNGRRVIRMRESSTS